MHLLSPSAPWPHPFIISSTESANSRLAARAPLIGVAGSCALPTTSSGYDVVVAQGPRNASSSDRPAHCAHTDDAQVQLRPNHGCRWSASALASTQERGVPGFTASPQITLSNCR